MENSNKALDALSKRQKASTTRVEPIREVKPVANMEITPVE